MNKKFFSLFILFVFCLSLSLLAETNEIYPGMKTKSTSRTGELVAPSRFQHHGPIYRPATRQTHVLFVEDPGQPGFGPAAKPDPQWTYWLDNTVGAGNYGWWGPVIDSSDGPPVDTMNLYDLVIWNCYDWWWTPCYAPTTSAVANMSTYMDGGGKVWFIGQDANYAYGAAFLTTFLNPYFDVQSVTDDVYWNIPSTSVTGENVLAGFAWTDSADYANNTFYCDEVTPTANGQQIVTDGTYHLNVITNDFTASFWTLDGRICTPTSEFVAVVDSMLKLFGIGATQDTHDVGVQSVVSPPAGPVTAGNYDVIGNVINYGNATETFDVVATVWDTAGWTVVFGPTTINLANFPADGDTNLDFGQVSFGANAYYWTEIYTALPGDSNPANDTAAVMSTTDMVLGDIIFEMDAETPTGDIRLLGVEFDGTYFYCTGARNYDSCFVYVLDTLGNLIWAMYQPSYCHGTWGWRDIAWDGVYAGLDRIDTLYASVNANVDPFGIDLATGTITYYTSFPGSYNPNRALAFYEDSSWFYTASFTSNVYWFSKTNPNIGNVANSWSMYGAAYDTDPDYGGWIWWHSQDDPGTGWNGQVEQYDPATQTFTGLNFGYMPTVTTPSAAGGACFYEGFRGCDVLFTMVQGSPDAIVGLFIRFHGSVDVDEEETSRPLTFGLSQNVPNPFTNGQTRIAYATSQSGPVSLKVYDNAGRLVRTLVDAKEDAGRKTVTWDGKDNNNNLVAAGVYFYRLTADGRTASRKMVVVR